MSTALQIVGIAACLAVAVWAAVKYVVSAWLSAAAPRPDQLQAIQLWAWFWLFAFVSATVAAGALIFRLLRRRAFAGGA
jgi:hypothetical protein